MVNEAPAPAQAQSTRDRLIAAAYRVVADDGLEAASVKAIAAKAEVTPGLVHYHFANKEAVIEATLRWAVETQLAELSTRRAATQPHRQVEALFAAVQSPSAAALDFHRFRLALAAPAMTGRALAGLIAETGSAIASELALVFATAAGRHIANDRELALATTLAAAIDGIMLARVADPEFPMATAIEILEQAAAAWVAQPRLI